MDEHIEPWLLDAYVEHALDPDQRDRVEQHLKICSNCGKRVEGHRRLMILASHLPLEKMPASLVLQVKSKLAQVKAFRQNELQRRRLGQVSLVLAAIGLVLLGTAWQQVVRILTALLNEFDNNLLTSILKNLINLLSSNWPELAQTELNWQAQIAKDVDAVLLGGAIFLSLAAFAAMARMLLSIQSSLLINNEE